MFENEYEVWLDNGDLAFIEYKPNEPKGAWADNGKRVAPDWIEFDTEVGVAFDKLIGPSEGRNMTRFEHRGVSFCLPDTCIRSVEQGRSKVLVTGTTQILSLYRAALNRSMGVAPDLDMLDDLDEIESAAIRNRKPKAPAPACYTGPDPETAKQHAPQDRR